MADTIQSPVAGVHGLVVLNPDGSQSSAATSGYSLSDYDALSNPIYLGKLAADGSWFITTINTSTGAKRYVKGASGYTTAWTARASQTYNYYDIIF